MKNRLRRAAFAVSALLFVLAALAPFAGPDRSTAGAEVAALKVKGVQLHVELHVAPHNWDPWS